MPMREIERGTVFARRPSSGTIRDARRGTVACHTEPHDLGRTRRPAEGGKKGEEVGCLNTYVSASTASGER